MTDEMLVELPAMRLADGRSLVWRGYVTGRPAPGPEPEPQPEPEPGGYRSGLPWQSGVFSNDPTMPERWGAMRGRPVDVADVHCDQADVGNPYWVRGYAPDTVGALMLSCPLTPGQQPSSYRVAGEAMRRAGFTGSSAILRPGVELNLRNLSSATDGNWRGWAQRFRAAADQFRDGAGPGGRVMVCVNEGSGAGLIGWDALQNLVSDLLVDGTADELGVDFYDQWEPMHTHAEFAARVSDSRRGSIGWWHRFAAGLGRKVSVPEWGCGRNDGPGQWAGHAGGDNPVFIAGMIDWFYARRSDIGLESYFSEPAAYIANDLTTQMPRARAAYKIAVGAYGR